MRRLEYLVPESYVRQHADAVRVPLARICVCVIHLYSVRFLQYLLAFEVTYEQVYPGHC